MGKKDKDKYSDFSNVTKGRNYLIPEEFPEGPAGEAIDKDKPITASKSTPWKEHQQRDSAFVYPDRELHDDLPRQTPGAHPIHDGSDEDRSQQEND